MSTARAEADAIIDMRLKEGTKKRYESNVDLFVIYLRDHRGENASHDAVTHDVSSKKNYGANNIYQVHFLCKIHVSALCVSLRNTEDFVHFVVRPQGGNLGVGRIITSKKLPSPYKLRYTPPKS
jgi:hypothetical protein